MLPFFADDYGNPATHHPAGRSASKAITTARKHIASAVGTNPDSIFFTSGATESNNLAVLGLACGSRQNAKIVVSNVEHKSVLEPAEHLRKHGFTVELLPVDQNGRVILSRARSIINSSTLVVSIQAANNETGVLQPVRELALMAHRKGALCHCDATQLLGKLPFDIQALQVDLASFSAHKVYGPKGVGALVVANKETLPLLDPILHGGGSTGKQLRPGTQNVPGIVGFGTACALSRTSVRREVKRISSLKSALEKDLLVNIPGSFVNSIGAPRLPGTTSLAVPGVPADMLIANLDSVCISSGSACNSGAPQPSHVLLAMGLTHAQADCTIRISLGRFTTEEEVHAACRAISSAVRQLRRELR